MQNYIKIHPDDKVAVALSPLEAGTTISIEDQEITLKENIPQGHKFALQTIEAQEPVIKYGSPIGITKERIPAGTWVHTHNMKTALGDLLTYTYEKQNTPVIPTEERFFQGYRRADLINHPNAGGVLVLGLGCENSNIGELKKYIGSYDENRVKFLVAQESDDEIEDALKLIQELVDYAAPLKREPISCKELIIGMKCGGLTASPASQPIQLSAHSQEPLYLSYLDFVFCH